jgi:CheY-like chemotaxis protein
MGGDLTVESVPDRGSVFRLEVTVTVPPPGELATTDAGATLAPLVPGLRILCAEDNPYGRVVLNTILAELGHQIEFVGNGEAAVEAVNRGGFDFVLMDVTLPVLDGVAAARRIRALTGEPALVPIIGLSGRTGVSEEHEARAAGMNAYLGKPISPAVLATLLSDLARK